MQTNFLTKQIPFGRPLNRSHPISKDIAGCWLLNDGGGQLAVDKVLNNNGTCFSAATFQKNSIGSSCSFDGTNSFIRCKTGTIVGGSYALTMAAWFKTTSASIGGGKAIYAERAPSGNNILKIDGFDTTTANGIIFTYRNDGGVIKQLRSTVTVNDGNWHHVALTKQGTTMNIYIDGLFDVTAAFGSSSDAFTNANLESDIGRDGTGSPTNFNGNIANVMVWKRCLTANEVRQLFYQPYCMFK